MAIFSFLSQKMRFKTKDAKKLGESNDNAKKVDDDVLELPKVLE